MKRIAHIRKILPNVSIYGDDTQEILGLSENSKEMCPGYVYFARKGIKHDGKQFVQEAIDKGAVAIVLEAYDPSIALTQIVHSSVVEAESAIADWFFGSCSKNIYLVGITGTCGKTTTSYIVKQFFENLGFPCGLIGSVEYIAGSFKKSASRTTPDNIMNQFLLADMVHSGMECCAMEVTSHAMLQGRVENLSFRVGVFTNITHEHLDYHKTMEQYIAAKNLFFRSLPEDAYAIVNIDDPRYKEVLDGCKASFLSYGIEKQADLMAKDIQGSSFILSYRKDAQRVQIPLVGRFNIYNTLAAIGVLLTKGIPFEKIISVLPQIKAPPGRLEQVYNSCGFSIFVDHAHKEDALAKVLPVLREATKGKLITVFGCGGDRDRFKRPKMAKVVESFSDLAIVTSDNPRSEDPEAIIEEIITGFSQKKYEVYPDREQAIFRAIQIADTDDCILIAGKGDEKQQIFARNTIPFDDVVVAQRGCEKKMNTF